MAVGGSEVADDLTIITTTVNELLEILPRKTIPQVQMFVRDDLRVANRPVLSVVLKDVEHHLSFPCRNIRRALATKGYGLYDNRHKKWFLRPGTYPDDAYIHVSRDKSRQRVCENIFFDQLEGNLVTRIHAAIRDRLQRAWRYTSEPVEEQPEVSRLDEDSEPLREILPSDRPRTGTEVPPQEILPEPGAARVERDNIMEERLEEVLASHAALKRSFEHLRAELMASHKREKVAREREQEAKERLEKATEELARKTKYITELENLLDQQSTSAGQRI